MGHVFRPPSLRPWIMRVWYAHWPTVPVPPFILGYANIRRLNDDELLSVNLSQIGGLSAKFKKGEGPSTSLRSTTAATIRRLREGGPDAGLRSLNV